jgi:beta-lactamase class D
MREWVFFLAILVSCNFSGLAQANVDFKKIFEDRDACFLILDLQTGKVVAELNPSRCEQRFSPYSSFKIPAALMAFEKGILKDENQVIKWDGIKRGRAEIDQDLTPLTWMSESAKRVTEWIMPQVGNHAIKSFLNAFNYGNKDFSGGFKDAWVSSSLKISAREQIVFISNFWNDKLGLTKRTTDLAKKVIFIKKLGKNAELYGKTGTGCLIGHACLDHADKMIGWFVGVLKTDSKLYVFAGNASDLKSQGPPAGPRMRKSTVEILKQMGLVSD